MEKIYKFKYINWLNLSGKLSDALLSKKPLLLWFPQNKEFW